MGHCGKRRSPGRLRYLQSLVLLIGVCGFFLPLSHAESRKHLLYINSYHPGMQWSDDIHQGICDALEKRTDLELHVEHLDSKRIWNDHYTHTLGEVFREKYADTDFAVILVSDDNALTFLRTIRKELFPDVPVVFCGINADAEAARQDLPGSTGLVENIDILATMQTAMQLQPGLKDFFVITDDTVTGELHRKNFTQAVSRIEGPVSYRFNGTTHLETLYDTLGELNPRTTAVLRLSLHRDSEGNLLDAEQVMHNVSRASSAPVYTCWENYMDTGVVGGMMMSGRLHGRTAGQLALRILDGADPDSIPVMHYAGNQLLLDYRALKRFGLADAELPANAVILHRPPNFFQRHRRALWVLGGVVGVFSLIVLGLLSHISRRRKREEALRNSERRWQALYEGLPGYSFITDEHQVIQDVNKALCELTGYPRDELIGKHCSLFCDLGDEQCPFLDGSASGFTNVESLIHTRDGRDIPVLKSARRIPLKGRDAIIENFQDITSWKEAEAVLLQNQAMERDFRQLLTTLHRISISLTSATSFDSLCRQAVLSTKEDLGFDRVGLWFISDDPHYVAGSYGIDEKGQLRDERHYRVPFRVDFQDVPESITSQPWVLADTGAVRNGMGEIVGHAPRAAASLWNGQEVTGFLAVDNLHSGQGITETQTRTLQLLAASLGHLCHRMAMEQERVQLAEAVEQAAEGILITTLDGTIQYANQGLLNLLGRTEADTVGKTIDMLLSPDNDAKVLADMQEAMSQCRPWSNRVCCRHGNGERTQVEMNLSPVRSRDERTSTYVHVLRDVSREAQLEEQLRQAAKMEAVGRLAGGLAHDFNNQLTVIKGYCDILLRELEEGEFLHDAIDQIAHATKQASGLTSELLSFSRRHVHQPEVVDPGTLLKGMKKSLSILGETMQLSIHVEPDTGCVEVDPNRMEQALMNLCINARDAMPDGGTLQITAQNVMVDDNLASLYVDASPGPYVLLTISDTGMGMDEDTRTHIFEPFFSTKSKGKGTGLGLAMVYGFVQQSGGYIDVDSTPDQGTTFHLFLPKTEKHTETYQPESSTQSPSGSTTNGQETILVVEDDKAVRQLVMRVLQEQGYHMLGTGIPEEAESLVDTVNGEIDLLISDVVMPNMDGPTLAKQLLRGLPELKILYISGYSKESVIQSGTEGPAVRFLHKPFAPEQICQAVREILCASPT